MEVASELAVDEVVYHGIDQGGGHGQQVDTQLYVLYPGKVGDFYKGRTGKFHMNRTYTNLVRRKLV